MSLHELHSAQGARLASDGIPLHYGDLKAEYHAALERAVLMDRSHEGRLALSGRDRLALPHRMSTNDLLNMAAGEGRVTVFTSPLGRILERVTVYNRGDDALLIGEAGRGPALVDYLRRNIFFNDRVTLADLSASAHLFALHGPEADRVMGELSADLPSLGNLYGAQAVIAGKTVFVARRKPLSGAHWIVLAPVERAADVWTAILEAGRPHGLVPAGSLTYNTLRIRAGFPGVGRELSQEFIPLEVGLWDEVSFSKGCYTGQEIIARMESRGRLARTMVRLQLARHVPAPAEVYAAGRRAGMLTSSVVSPDDEIFAIGVLKVQHAQLGAALTVGEARIEARVLARAGVQPDHILPDSTAET